MLKIRHAILVLGMLLSPAAPADDVRVSIGIGLPHASIGIHLGGYPRLVAIPGYPVYYAPGLPANFFFFDGMYWVFVNNYWYASYWYNGPWWYVSPVAVPVYILRIPVRYYRSPPPYFRAWRRDAPPRWGDHWGRDWQQRRGGWDRWDRRAAPPPLAPLPAYQERYSGDRYPRQVERQRELHRQNYRYQPREPVVRQHYEERYQPPQRRDDDARRPPPPPPQQGQSRRDPQTQGSPREDRQGRDERGRDERDRERERDRNRDD
jgi:hypothetical protein